MTSCVCLKKSGMKFVFHWKAQFFILFESLFKFSAVVVKSYTPEKCEVPSSERLGLEAKLSDRSFMQIINNRGARIEP